VLNLQHVQLQAELLQVVVCFLRQMPREAQPVFVDFLRRQLRQHASQVAGQRLACEALHFLLRFTKQTLNCVIEHRIR
jgi:hypothetical protein